MSFQEKVTAWIKKVASRFGIPSRVDALKIGLILIVLFISVFAGDLFPGTQFALMIERTFGQFFNLTGALESSLLLIVESLAILVFIWTLIQLLGWVFLLFKEKGKEPTMGVALAQSALKYLLYVTGAVMVLTTCNNMGSGPNGHLSRSRVSRDCDFFRGASGDSRHH